ncbi:ROK family protein [Clostridium chrysemydis]|uniref:ROK family protein n=1 Tax=Clostridium chrysemydis TaxID=2665504 RepID=UPI0018832C1A|nr:ROK family protein [Clostridium chrysemydis]
MANSRTIKEINVNSIRNALFKKKDLSKSEISKITNLSFPTVSTVLEYLIDKEEVKEEGLKESIGGRCSKKYILNPLYKVSLLICLEGDTLEWKIIDYCETIIEEGLEDTKGDILLKIEELIIKKKENYDNLYGITIGVASIIKDGRFLSDIEYKELKGVDVEEYLFNKFNLPTNIDNDLNIVARGYIKRKSLENGETVVNIYIGDNGIGASLIIGGKVFKGMSNFAGEITFLPILENEKDRFKDIDMITYYSKVILSYISIINPNEVVLYNNEYLSEGIEKIEDYLKKKVTKEVIPRIILSNEFKKDYEVGLIEISKELIKN